MKRVLAAGLAVGVALAVLVAVVGGPGGDRRPPTDAFLEAWERSLTSTYAITQRVDRRLVSGRAFSSEVRLVQRPPDRVRVGSAGTEGQVGGQRFGCVPDGGCRIGGLARPYAEVVDEQMDLVRALVVGTRAAYAVRRAEGDGCFLLVLRGRVLVPPYGEDATFCFDERTGAQVSSVVHRAEATDTTTTIDLRGDVRDADLALPEELRA